MAKTRNQTLKIHLGGKALVILALYSALLLAAGASFRSCDSKAKQYGVKAKSLTEKVR